MSARVFTLAMLAWAVMAGAVVAQVVETATPPKPRPDPASLIAPVSGQALKAERGPSGLSAWIMLDLDSGRTLDAYSADVPMAPASVAKLVTALYAIEMLGPEHRFETRLMASGPVAPGVLRGDLVLVGGGDPELDTDQLVPLVAAAREAGLTQVTGRFLVDGAAGVSAPVIDPGQPVEASYNPGVSALNLNFNRVRLRWPGRRSDGGLPLTAEAEELAPPVDLVSAVAAPGGGGQIFRHAIAQGTERWRIASAVLTGQGARWLPVKRPSLYAGDAFVKIAQSGGLVLPPPAEGSTPEDASLIARVESRPLSEIVADMLDFSTNITAEAVGVAASRAAGFAPETLEGSARIMSAWAGRLAALPGAAGKPALANHSGLSAESRMSPRQIAEFLRAAAQRPLRDENAHPRLPGPLAPLLTAFEVEDEDIPLDYDALEVVAKSGTMDYIRGLAGYAVTPKGRRVAFAILSNDLGQRDGVRRQIDRGWMGRARWFERALIRNWVLELEGFGRG